MSSSGAGRRVRERRGRSGSTGSGRHDSGVVGRAVLFLALSLDYSCQLARRRPRKQPAACGLGPGDERQLSRGGRSAARGRRARPRVDRRRAGAHDRRRPLPVAAVRQGAGEEGLPGARLRHARLRRLHRHHEHRSATGRHRSRRRAPAPRREEDRSHRGVDGRHGRGQRGSGASARRSAASSSSPRRPRSAARMRSRP